MPGLQDIVNDQKRRAAATGGAMTNLWLKENDFVTLHFLGDGNEGDRYFTSYRAHAVKEAGQQYDKLVYCPVLSQHDADYACPYCHDLGSYPVKDRLAIWVFVHQWFRQEKNRPEDTVQQVDIYGQKLYQYDIGKAMFWEASAYYGTGASPLREIETVYQRTGNRLDARLIEMRVMGKALQRAYSLRESTEIGELDAETKTTALAELPTVVERLRDGLTAVQEVTRENAAGPPAVGSPPAMAAAPTGDAPKGKYNFMQRPNVADPFKPPAS